jgi:hypothetical protein
MDYLSMADTCNSRHRGFTYKYVIYTVEICVRYI